MTRTSTIALCSAVARELERSNRHMVSFADCAYSHAFFAEEDPDACFNAGASAFVLAVVPASCGWPI